MKLALALIGAALFGALVGNFLVVEIVMRCIRRMWDYITDIDGE